MSVSGIPLRLAGSITALATPFTGDGAIDQAAWQRLLRAQLDAGTQALVVAGSTGEAAALTDPEFDTLVRSAVDLVQSRVPIVVGTGLANTLKSIEQTRRAARCGADAALVVVPPYVRPTQAGLIAHYRAVADDGALPLLLYNVPGRTGCDLLPEAVAELALHPRIVGIKEARSDRERMQALLALRPNGFQVFSGDDPTACRAMLDGADGVVSVAANVAPRAFRALCDAARAGDAPLAQRLDAAMRQLYAFLGIESNPIPLKALLVRLGIGEAQGIRLPLTPLAAEHATMADGMAAAIPSIESSCRDAFAA